ncbi:hypothetical protein B7463_g8566, partial [Scytalidium lignicola]
MLQTSAAVRLLTLLSMLALVQAAPFVGSDFGPDTNISCSDVGDPNVDPATRWATALADEAFSDAVKDWNSQKARILGALLVLVTSPAGWMILNSFANFHNYFDNLFQAITNAQVDIQGEIQDFANEFATPVATNHDDNVGLILTIISSVLAVALSFVSAGAALGAIAGLAGDAAKQVDKGASVISSLSSNAFSIAKEALPTDQQQLINAAALDDMIVTATNSMQSTLSTILTGFSAESGSFNVAQPESTQDLFANGTWLNAPLGQDEYDYKGNFKKILYGALINATFTITPNLHPALAYQQKDCSDTSNEPYSQFGTARSCAVPGVVSYLLSMDMNDYQVGWQPDVASDQLTGDPNAWGGVKFDEVVSSIYNGWTASGSPASGVFTPDDINFFQDGSGNKAQIPWPLGIETPAFFNIPVCDVNTFYNNIFYMQAQAHAVDPGVNGVGDGEAESVANDNDGDHALAGNFLI